MATYHQRPVKADKKTRRKTKVKKSRKMAQTRIVKTMRAKKKKTSAQKAREATDKMAPHVPGGGSARKLRSKSRRALEDLGI